MDQAEPAKRTRPIFFPIWTKQKRIYYSSLQTCEQQGLHVFLLVSACYKDKRRDFHNVIFAEIFAKTIGKKARTRF